MIRLDGRSFATITRAIGDAKFAFLHLINEIFCHNRSLLPVTNAVLNRAGPESEASLLKKFSLGFGKEEEE